MGLAAWNSRLISKSPTPTFVEIFFTLPAHEMMKLIDRFYFEDIELTYAGEPTVAANLKKLHESVTQTTVRSKSKNHLGQIRSLKSHLQKSKERNA
jgi:hypothetical protein